MSSSKFLWIFAVLLFLPSWCLGEGPKPKPDPLTYVGRGAWSSESISLFNEFGGFGWNSKREASFHSPDHKKLVRIHSQKVTISIEGKEYITDFCTRSSAELGWAPDSSRFFLTWTDGGETGEWHVDVYDITSHGLKRIKSVDSASKKDFDHFVRSRPRRPESVEPFWDTDLYCSPNAVASQWLGSATELLISVLVPNVGDCRYSSEFSVYRVEVPSGRILQRYTAEQAYKQFNRDNLPLRTN